MQERTIPAMTLVRYAKYHGHHPREVVLLRGRPCIWSRCTFCDYIADNTSDEAEMERVAELALANVTGQFGRLQVSNSGSIHELPPSVLDHLRQVIHTSGITDCWAEFYWAYRDRVAQIQDYLGIETHLFLGVETFDDRLRNEVLHKSMHWHDPRDVAAVTDSICLLIGFRGQTRDSVRRDIDLLLSRFKYGIINVFTPNTRSVNLLDLEIQDWFRQEFAYLEREPSVDVLWKNTELGVG